MKNVDHILVMDVDGVITNPQEKRIIESEILDYIVQKLELEELVKNENLNGQLKVDSTTIATDIENKHVGKDFAVKKIIEWLKNKGINPKIYITFGDSFSSDITMAEEIHSQGFPVEFVYVGKEHIDTSDFSFSIRQTQAKFEKGTLEFLKTL